MASFGPLGGQLCAFEKPCCSSDLDGRRLVEACWQSGAENSHCKDSAKCTPKVLGRTQHVHVLPFLSCFFVSPPGLKAMLKTVWASVLIVLLRICFFNNMCDHACLCSCNPSIMFMSSNMCMCFHVHVIHVQYVHMFQHGHVFSCSCLSMFMFMFHDSNMLHHVLVNATLSVPCRGVIGHT